MRKPFLILFVVSVLVAPAIVSAQALPALGGAFGRSSCCGEEAAPGGGLDFGIGYLGDPGGARLDFVPNNNFGGVFPLFRHSFPLEGLWLGASANIPLDDRMTFFLTGSWLVPSNGGSEEDYSYPYILTIRYTRKWNSSIQWYTLGAGGSFSLTGPVAFLAGFRYDSFQVGFSDPEDAPFFWANRRVDEADVRVNLYMPYVGLVCGLGSTVKVGFIGFPYLPGDVKYGETWGNTNPPSARFEMSGNVSNSYFMEIFVEGGANLAGANISLFGKWEYLRSRASLDMDVGTNPTAPTFNDTVDMVLDRQCWTIGGKFALNFISPL